MTGDLLRYRGQTQKWFLLHFHGGDEEIDLSCHGEPEFSDYRWMPVRGVCLKFHTQFWRWGRGGRGEVGEPEFSEYRWMPVRGCACDWKGMCNVV